MLGRTHGQAAVPITFGLKVAVWLDELVRHLIRLEEAEPRIAVGKFLGAVGTGAARVYVHSNFRNSFLHILALEFRL